MMIMAAGDWNDLIHAIEQGDEARVKYYVQNGVDLNYQHPEFMTTPLIVSIESGHIELTQLLLKNGANPRLKAGFSNDSPLDVAKKFGNHQAIYLLKPFYPDWRHRLWKILNPGK